MLQHQYHSDSVVAEIRHSSGEPRLFRMSDIPVYEKLEKFIEDVRYVDLCTCVISIHKCTFFYPVASDISSFRGTFVPLALDW